ncbi:MAG: iron-sulfur cluster repair di-iron protein [Planctomycetes bacterium]|nr:iron-sulfur cluster repair di-iron protein [Planctomycetota bacterium]
MEMTTHRAVGEIAANFPLATRVFARHGIDYCCGGGVAIGEVCHTKGLDALAILKEIEEELRTKSDPESNWNEAPLVDLIDHILAVHHVPLYEELARLEMMARKVCDVHHEKDPTRLPELVAVYTALKEELIQHMGKEEQVLFPMIKAGHGRQAIMPIQVMHHEHDGAGRMLARIRELCDDFVPRADACNTWRALWASLEALEADLHQHIHLENNILFPRALKEG